MKALAIAAGVFVICGASIVSFSTTPQSSNAPSAAQTSSPADPVSSRVDALFAQWNTRDSPGCSLAVTDKGVVVHERGYGMANLELDVAITPASVFEAASISKSFTAMSVLLLAQRGRLSLDDQVRKHIPEWTDSRITIRHLITHTAGLRDVFLLIELAAPRSGDVNDTIVNLLARQRGLNFAPGSQYEYNNGGYTVLADIVKRVSGQPLRVFADANIFKPLGMTDTYVRDDPAMMVRNRVSGYNRDEHGFRLGSGGAGVVVGNSGLLSTARDLLRWAQNFADRRVGDEGLLAAMQKPAVLDGGASTSYGLGLEIGQHRGLRTIGHSGGGGGYATNLAHYPDHGFAVAVLCNVDNVINPVVLTRGVAEIYLERHFKDASDSGAGSSPVSLSAGQLASKTGLYRDRSDGTYGRIFMRDGKLMAIANAGTDGEAYELTPVAANRFVIAGSPIVAEFVPAAGGHAQEIHVTGVGPKVYVSEQVKEGFAPSSAQLRAFSGQYRSEDLDVIYTLAPRDRGLVLRIPGRPPIDLRPILPDAFHGSLVDVMTFSRDSRGGVTGFNVRSSGARNLRFDRVTR